jgi:hypothetical protein
VVSNHVLGEEPGLQRLLYATLPMSQMFERMIIPQHTLDQETSENRSQVPYYRFLGGACRLSLAVNPLPSLW